jgi:hypothetical protein
MIFGIKSIIDASCRQPVVAPEYALVRPPKIELKND